MEFLTKFTENWLTAAITNWSLHEGIVPGQWKFFSETPIPILLLPSLLSLAGIRPIAVTQCNCQNRLQYLLSILMTFWLCSQPSAA